MAYSSKRGRRPAEFASKVAHSHIINDETIVKLLEQCILPADGDSVYLENHEIIKVENQSDPIEHVIAIDGGYREIQVKKEYPSASVCFFQMGALIFSVKDLEEIDNNKFIDPADMSKLKNIERMKLALPMRNVVLKGKSSLAHSIRHALYEFFETEEGLGTSLSWIIFQEYKTPVDEWILSNCPWCVSQK